MGRPGAIHTGNLPHGFDTPVYENTDEPQSLVITTPNRMFSDDIRLSAAGGCAISGFEIMVGRAAGRCGDQGSPCVADDDCAGTQTCQPYEDEGFTVSYALYDGCPGAGGQIIPGSSGTRTFNDNQVHAMVVSLEDAGTVHVGTVWIGVSFDKEGAGWLAGQPAQIGYTENRFHIDGFGCNAKLGSAIYSGFHARVFCANDPSYSVESYAYVNEASDLPMVSHPAGAGHYVVDDIELIVTVSNIASYAVGLRGTLPYTATIELWDECYPESVIEGSQFTFMGEGNGDVEIASHQLPDTFHTSAAQSVSDATLYLAVRTNQSNSGPVLAGEPEVGESAPTLVFFDWPEPGPTCDFENGVWNGNLNATISYRGHSRPGACCRRDPFRSDPIAYTCGDTRALACHLSEGRFNLGGHCRRCSVSGAPCREDLPCAEAVCSDTFQPCDADDACPGTETCVPQSCAADTGAFSPACGEAACCTPPTHEAGEGCFNLPFETCDAIIDDQGNAAAWSGNSFCESDDASCGRWSCRVSGDACGLGHGSPGCRDIDCCEAVCQADAWCCEVQWDPNCVVLSEDLCALAPANTYCIDAMTMTADTPIDVSTVNAVRSPVDPELCCDPQPQETAGNTWFRFVATDTTARVHTCDSQIGRTSVVAVYEPLNAESPASACAGLVALGCSAEQEGCGDGKHADLCVNGLTPGETYYVELSTPTAADASTFRIELETPCPLSQEPHCPADAVNWTVAGNRILDPRQPFPPGAPESLQTIDSLTFDGPADLDTACCWSVCSSADGPAFLDGIDDTPGEFAIARLDGPTPPYGITRVNYRGSTGAPDALRIVNHPGNVNDDDVTDAQDIRGLIERLEGMIRDSRTNRTVHETTSDDGQPGQTRGNASTTDGQAAPIACDINRDGACGPEDILRLIDLLHGGASYPSWFGSTRPAENAGCLQP